MNQLKGTIYIRDNEWFRSRNVVKIGIASYAKDRNSTYITSEPLAGEYIYVIEIPLDKMKILDKYLKLYFIPHNVYHICSGTEFYNRCIIDLIEPYLKNINISYKVLTKEEINLMNRCERVRNIPNVDKVKKAFNQLNIKNIIQNYKIKRSKKGSISNNIVNELSYMIEPNNHQQYILEIIEGFFNLYNIGKIVWACGLGKALLSILIVELLKFKSVVIGVPSNNLQKQITNEILKIFPSKTNLLCVGGNDIDGIKSTTYKRQIIQFLNNNINSQTKFVISTYHSCHLLVDTDIVFELKIGDEAHHLVGVEREENRGFRLFHKIFSLKTLFMTATEKTIETQTNKEIYSMDDEAFFGKNIDIKTVYWAIENKKITDYNILVLKNTEETIDEIVSSLRLNIINKEIFISCYMCLKSFEKYNDLTHLLLYTNTTEDAELAKKYIDELLNYNEQLYLKEEIINFKKLIKEQININKLFQFRKNDIYNNALHSNTSYSTNYNDLDSEVNKFKNTSYGIISCVYIFGEGFDLPKLNGVCIAGNMKSETRIVQYLLRPNRLEVGNPNKKAYVIIPYIDTDDWETENKSYEKIRNIISQMRNVDENIEQKIFVLVEKKEKKIHTKKDEERIIHYEDYNFEENGNELNKIKLRLRYSKALGSKFTEEQDEYNYVRSINSSLNIKSKKEYIERKDNHNHFIAYPEEYFKSKGVWNNWYNFMGVDTIKFIQSKQDWINFCKEKSIKSLDDYYMNCEEHDILPKEPDELYSHFTNIPCELKFNKIRRR
jgi:predicted helicase